MSLFIERTIQVSFRHQVHFTKRVFDPANPLLRTVLQNNENREIHKALVVVDEALSVAQPTLTQRIEAYFAAYRDCLNMVCPPLVIEGGERTKNSYFHV